MIVEKFTAATVLDLQLQAAGTTVQNLVERDPDDGDHVVPGVVRRALAELRLLHHVPFSYLVADASLLPPESIRFFYLDRNWTDAVIQGVLSVGTFTAADRRQLEELMPIIHDEVDEAERALRRPTGEERLEDRGAAITGFLLRSKLVSGWPGLHVRAYRSDRQDDDDIIPESDPDRLKVLRLERLAPAVLLVLFDGVPAVVHVEEPRQGIQFGALRATGDPLSTRHVVPLRNAATGADLSPARGRTRAVPAQRRRCHRPGRATPADGPEDGDAARPGRPSQRVRPRDAAVPVPPGVRRPGQRTGRGPPGRVRAARRVRRAAGRGSRR